MTVAIARTFPMDPNSGATTFNATLKAPGNL